MQKLESGFIEGVRRAYGEFHPCFQNHNRSLPSGTLTLFSWCGSSREGISQDALIEGFQNLCWPVINLNHTAANRYSPGERQHCAGYQPQRVADPGSASRCRRSSWSSRRLGPGHTAVSTPGDLHFYIRATQPSVAYDMASALLRLCAILLRY